MRNSYLGVFVVTLLAGGCMMMGHDRENSSGGWYPDDDSEGHCRAGDCQSPGTGSNPGGSSGGSGGDESGSAGQGGSETSCAGDSECPSGSYCASERNECVPSGPCELEVDCAPGFNCDPDRGTCAPAAEETCPELATEQSCAERQDCEPVYAGVDCSCGVECVCVGGDPGCVCERFEFFKCVPASS